MVEYHVAQTVATAVDSEVTVEAENGAHESPQSKATSAERVPTLYVRNLNDKIKVEGKPAIACSH